VMTDVRRQKVQGLCVQNSRSRTFSGLELRAAFASNSVLLSREGFQRAKIENRRQKVPELPSSGFPGVGHFRGLLRLGHSARPSSVPVFVLASSLPCRSSPPLSGKHCAFAHDTLCCVLSVLYCVYFRGLKLQIEFPFLCLLPRFRVARRHRCQV
jgi:hypothetical protein